MIPSALARLARSVAPRAALASLGVVTLLLACTTTPKTKEDSLCSPGNYVFCRCRDRQDGAKLCKDDGQSFGPCEPCESYDNPEGPLEPGDPTPDEPLPDPDGGQPDPNGSCGDGVVQRGEDCDDKNTNETDGCDSSCKLAGATPQKTVGCPGLDVHVWGGTHKPTLAGTTTNSGNRKVKTTCGSSTGSTPTSGASSEDRVFKVMAHKTGSMTVAVTDTSYNAFLYVAETCPSDDVEWIACANKVDGVGNETVTLPVDEGKTYYVFVDGALPSNLDTTKLKGNFRVTFSIP
ncbi:MAG: hypothetical protein KF764_13855 [Labilithrix sp.]|nr:hypothetical protein [Labilithrix sp.]